MPELPEVESTVRALRLKVLGQTLLHVHALDPVFDPVPKSLLLPVQVRALERRGKYILFGLGDLWLVVHLRMSGRLRWEEGQARPPHTRLVLEFPQGNVLFVDVRRLGTVEVVPEFTEELGPDALSDLSFLPEALRESRAPIKVWLLDQRNIAGIGNIYAAEILFRAGIDPRRPANSLGPHEVQRLKEAIPEVLEEAIEALGTTLADGAYQTPEGEAGDYEPWVYGREGLPCKMCGTPIERIELGGRGTYFCPRCQR